MPPDLKGKSTVRRAPYDVLHRKLPSTGIIHPTRMITSSASSELSIDAHPLPLCSFDSPSKPTNDFVSRLSEYLRSKNESYKEELGKMEDALSQAEAMKNSLKQTIDTLGKTVDALEGAVTAASHILSASLVCSICYETSSQPTSLKCGHSFCRDCLQGWFLSKFESRCAEKRIDLNKSKYQYIYMPASSVNETERNMLAFAALSNLIRPDYSCPSCRDTLLPSVRNSYLDFKLSASLTTLNALIRYVPPDPPGWKLASVDMLSFLNSRFFSKQSEGRFSANFIDADDIDMELDASSLSSESSRPLN